jgi:hypothetical protein
MDIGILTSEGTGIASGAMEAVFFQCGADIPPSFLIVSPSFLLPLWGIY